MELLTTGLTLLVLTAVGVVVAFMHRQRRDASDLRQRAATLEAQLAAKSDHALRLENEATTHRRELDELRAEKGRTDVELATTELALKHAEEKAREQAEILTTRFRVLSAEMLESHSTTLQTQNKEQIEGLLTPLRQKIVEFEEGLAKRHIQAAEHNAALREQLAQLGTLNQAIVQEANNLTRALKGESRTQGAWGEMILEAILEKSGLREGVEYDSQESATDGEGRRLRPDIVVNLPAGEKLIIDSKVSLTAFEEFVNSEDQEKKKRALAAHVASLRAHVEELAKKDYTRAVGSRMDYVIMFVPIEGALAAALGADTDLAGSAIERNVAIATPTTLMTVLKTVAAMWRIERQHQHAEEIAKRAGLLYDKFVGFNESLDDVGQRIKQAQSAFDQARGRLATGAGNLVRQVETIKALGARTKKALPDELVAEAGPPDPVDDEKRELAQRSEERLPNSLSNRQE